MWTDILRMAVSNGLWAVLFCLLLFHQVKDSRRREGKYQGTIEQLTERLRIVRDMKEEIIVLDNDVREVRDHLIRRRNGTKKTGRTEGSGEGTA